MKSKRMKENNDEYMKVEMQRKREKIEKCNCNDK